MKSNCYVAIKRAKFVSNGVQVNIPYGTEIEAADGCLLFNGTQLCAVDSQNAIDYFASNHDGNGFERGKLTAAIINRLSKRDKDYQKRWDAVWEDKLCQKYKQSDYGDHWLWNIDFYHAPLVDLYHIAHLVGARVK